MDLASYFDTVSHSKLIEVLSRTIKDGRVVSLIHKFLNAGVMTEFGIEDTVTGVPQGGCISPLLGNIMLNELDKELQRRGHRFVRYADDCIIFCKSEKSANRTLKNIVPFITDKLFLKVNLDKTTVAPITKIKYLGYGFYRFKGKCRLRLHPKSLRKVKGKLKELTCRANRWSNPRERLGSDGSCVGGSATFVWRTCVRSCPIWIRGSGGGFGLSTGNSGRRSEPATGT